MSLLHCVMSPQACIRSRQRWWLIIVACQATVTTRPRPYGLAWGGVGWWPGVGVVIDCAGNIEHTSIIISVSGDVIDLSLSRRCASARIVVAKQSVSVKSYGSSEVNRHTVRRIAAVSVQFRPSHRVFFSICVFVVPHHAWKNCGFL